MMGGLQPHRCLSDTWATTVLRLFESPSGLSVALSFVNLFLSRRAALLCIEQLAKHLFNQPNYFHNALSFFIAPDGEPLEWKSKRALQPTEPPGEAALY